MKPKNFSFYVYRGLLDRLNKIRYANPADPLEREAACHAVQQRLFDGVRPMRMEDNVGNIEGQNPGDQGEVEHANEVHHHYT